MKEEPGINRRTQTGGTGGMETGNPEKNMNQIQESTFKKHKITENTTTKLKNMPSKQSQTLIAAVLLAAVMGCSNDAKCSLMQDASSIMFSAGTEMDVKH